MTGYIFTTCVEYFTCPCLSETPDRERRSSIVVSTSAWHAIVRTRHVILRGKNLDLNITDCVSLVGVVAQWLERYFESWATFEALKIQKF